MGQASDYRGPCASFGRAIKRWLSGALPEPAPQHLESGFSGDEDAAGKLVGTAPNRYRGYIAVAAYHLGVPNPGYREIIRAVWCHDHSQMLSAASGRRNTVRRMIEAAEFSIPLCGPTRIYRGTSALGRRTVNRGISWTVSRDMACWFAFRSGSNHFTPFVITALVDPSEIILWDNSRNEEEVIPGKVPKWVIDPNPETWRAAFERQRAKMHAEVCVRLMKAKERRSVE